MTETQMNEDPIVFESISIPLPKTMPRSKRILEVSKQISEWLKSLESPYNFKTNMLRLNRIEQINEEYVYHYEIHRKVED